MRSKQVLSSSVESQSPIAPIRGRIAKLDTTHFRPCWFWVLRLERELTVPVYVDDYNARYRGILMCHMIAKEQ